MNAGWIIIIISAILLCCLAVRNDDPKDALAVICSFFLGMLFFAGVAFILNS